MTGSAHIAETSYEPHRNRITGVVNRAKPGGARSPLPASPDPAPAADSGPSTKHDGPSTLSSYLYANDLLGRRETISQGGEAFGMLALGENRVEVAYNDRSEVVGAVTRRGDIPVARHSYAYDAIGNRQRSASEVGTRAAGRRSESESNRKSEVSYEANALNQYAEVKTLSVDSVNSVGRPVHDPDGNLIEDARHRYTWNADNNLVRVESKDGSLRLDYLYDHQSRRTVRIETTNPGKDNESRRTTYYVYDDWNLLADVSAVTGDGSRVMGEEADAVRCYTWGRDLSGSLQGAGGVGGLLAISRGEEHRYPTYDANGNIGQLIDGAGATVAAYAYDPFGNVTEMAGAEAAENPWRFSTKPVEAGTGWLYYGYRWYDAEIGRWVNRDPIEESGGVNLYGFVGNDGVERWDFLGLDVQWKEDEFTMVAHWTMNDGIKSLGVSAVGISFPLGVSAEFSLTGRREGDIVISQSSGMQPGEVVLPDGCVWCGPPVLVSANISEPTVTLRYKNQWMFVTFWDTSTSYKATARIKWKMQYKC